VKDLIALAKKLNAPDYVKRKRAPVGPKIIGGPCSKCGGTLRYESNHNCVECLKKYAQRERGGSYEGSA